MQARSTWILAAILFVLSGALGLGYQLVWIKKAALIVGASQVALATVVASFFLGLALGSLFVGRSRRWRRSPLLVYGLFELGIGAFALAFPWLFEMVEAVYGVIYPVFAGRPLGLFFARFVLLFVFFLPPTFLMGGTLPLLLDGLVGRDRAIGAQTSTLYGLNILGAVLGVLLTGYWAVPVLGMNTTSLVAGCGNLALGAVAFLAFRGAPSAARGEAPAPERLQGVFVALAFLSGFAALGYQVAWVRYFALLRDPTVHLTAVFLATYLAALSLGSLLLAPLLRRGAEPLRVLGVVQPLVAVLVFLLLDTWVFAQHGFLQLDPEVSFDVEPLWKLFGEDVDALFVAPLVQIAMVLFVPVALLGMGLPAIIAAATRSSGALRASAGTIVFWNTLGSSAGSFAAGYLGIPFLGLTRTLLGLAAVSLLIGLVAEQRAGPIAGQRRFLRPGFVLAVFAAVLCLHTARRDVAEEVVRSYGQRLRGGLASLEEMVEGPLTTAYVFRSPERTYLGAGRTMLAVAEHGMLSHQTLQGHLPALFYPAPGAPRRVLAIALGSGQSFGALLLHDVEEMDVVDISSEVVDLSLRHFSAYNHGLADDPRVRFHLDDGRHFIERAPDAHYDAISMEPPPPTAEGVHTLYSLEFYREAKRVLRENGVLMQWLPLYRTTPEDLRAMLRTQAAVFPETFAIRVGSGDLAVTSFDTVGPPRFELGWIDARLRGLRRERLARGHREPGTHHPLDSRLSVLARLLTGPEDIAALPGTLLHRDDDQGLSYSSGDRGLLRRYEVTGPLARLTFAALPITPFENLARYFAEPIPVRVLGAERARTLQRYNLASPEQLRAAERRYAAASGPAQRAHAALRVAALHDQSLHKSLALEWVGRALEEGTSTPRDRAIARAIARHGRAVYGDELLAFLGALPAAQRSSPLAQELARGLVD